MSKNKKDIPETATRFRHMWYAGNPKPFDEAQDSDIFWKSDKFDAYLPKRLGFITDCIYSFRGKEAPSIFTLWTSLFILSSCIKREAWLTWGDGKLFPNLYVILVGPAGKARKGSSITLAEELIEDYPQYITNPYWQYRKKTMVIKNKATPESIVERLLPKEKAKLLKVNEFVYKVDDMGNKVRSTTGFQKYEMTSEGCLMLPELSVMISKQKYNESLTDLLMDLYDAKKTWDWSTKGEGVKQLKETFLSLLGATTKTGFRESIPISAAGDGFLSRTIIAYSDGGERCFPVPRLTKDGPDMEELRKRLAWITENASGEYTLSEKANEYYSNWYRYFHMYQNENPEIAGIISRKGINLLKIALLIRANLYKGGHEIQKEDIKEAESILEITYKEGSNVISEIQGGEYVSDLNRIAEMIRSNGKLNRKQLAQRGKLKMKQLDEILINLSQQKKIRIWVDGHPDIRPRGKSGEEYYWNEK